MIDHNKLFKLFYDTEPKIIWRMSKSIRTEISKMKSLDGRFVLAMDELFMSYDLFGHSIQIIEEDKLTLLYVFSDGTEKEFELNLEV